MLGSYGLQVHTVPGALRNAGRRFETWFDDHERLVPPALTDEQWACVEDLFPRPKKQSRIVPPRLAFEASLHKVSARPDVEGPPAARHPRAAPQGLYQRALEYLNTGVWERAVCALGDYDGTPAPPLYGPHIENLRVLRDLGVDQFAVYDMHHAREATIDVDAYGSRIIPALST